MGEAERFMKRKDHGGCQDGSFRAKRAISKRYADLDKVKLEFIISEPV